MTREVYKHGRAIARTAAVVAKIYANAKQPQHVSVQSRQTAAPRRRHRPNARQHRNANVALQPPAPGAHSDNQLRHPAEPPEQSVRLIGYYPSAPPSRESIDTVSRLAYRFELQTLHALSVFSTAIYAALRGVSANNVPNTTQFSDSIADPSDSETPLPVVLSLQTASKGKLSAFSVSVDNLAEKLLVDLTPSTVLAMMDMWNQARDSTSFAFLGLSDDTHNMYAESYSIPNPSSDCSEATQSSLFEYETDTVGEHLHDILMSHSDNSSEWEEYEVVEHGDDCDCDDWEQI